MPATETRITGRRHGRSRDADLSTGGFVENPRDAKAPTGLSRTIHRPYAYVCVSGSTVLLIRRNQSSLNLNRFSACDVQPAAGRQDPWLHIAENEALGRWAGHQQAR